MPCRALEAFGPAVGRWWKDCQKVLMPCRALEAFGLDAGIPVRIEAYES